VPHQPDQPSLPYLPILPHQPYRVVSYPPMKTFTLCAAAILVAATTVAAQKYDMTGEWAFEVTTDAGSGTPTFVLKQTGDKITGKYKGILGEADVTGTVSGKTFKLSFSGDAQGTAVTATYDGEFESATSVKGKMEIAGLGAGTFTGKKVK